MATAELTLQRLASTLRAAGEELELSPVAIRHYSGPWSALAKFCLREGIELPELDVSTARRFYQVQTAGLGPEAHYRLKSAMAQVFRYCQLADPFESINSPAAIPDKTQFLIEKDLEALFRVLSEHRRDGYYEHLAWTLSCCLFHTAGTFGEWSRLTLDRIARSSRGLPQLVCMRAKSGREREVPLGVVIGRHLDLWLDYLKGRQQASSDRAFANSKYAFPAPNGAALPNQKFCFLLAGACARARIPRITTHSFRFTAVLILLRKHDLPLRNVRNLLGHRHDATVARYAQKAEALEQMRHDMKLLEDAAAQFSAPLDDADPAATPSCAGPLTWLGEGI